MIYSFVPGTHSTILVLRSTREYNKLCSYEVRSELQLHIYIYIYVVVIWSIIRREQSLAMPFLAILTGKK